MIIKKIIGILTLIFVLLGTFSFVSGDSGALLVSKSSQIGGDLLVLLLEVKSIELQGDIFEDKAFINLKDFGIEIPSQPVGRDNPFSSTNF